MESSNKLPPHIGENHEATLDACFPSYAKISDAIWKEKGRTPVTRNGFDARSNGSGALVVGSPEHVAEKIIRYSNRRNSSLHISNG